MKLKDLFEMIYQANRLSDFTPSGRELYATCDETDKETNITIAFTNPNFINDNTFDFWPTFRNALEEEFFENIYLEILNAECKLNLEDKTVTVDTSTVRLTLRIWERK